MRALLVAVGLLLVSCSGKRPQSGYWNDQDADQVVRTMVPSCLSYPAGQPWWHWFAAAHGGRKPVVRLYRVKNHSSEQINDEYFTAQIERALLASGRMDLVATPGELVDIEAELDDQKKNASDETVKSRDNAIGADFLLGGVINTQNDLTERKDVRAYVVTMHLIEVETRKKAWIGEQKIRKQLDRAAFGP